MIPGILAACPTLERYRTLSHNTLEAGVCTKNLSSGVVVVKSAEDGV